MFTSVQSVVIYSQWSTKIDILKFRPVSEQGAETRFQKETATHKQTEWLYEFDPEVVKVDKKTEEVTDTLNSVWSFI